MSCVTQDTITITFPTKFSILIAGYVRLPSVLLVPGIELAVRPSHLYRNRIADKGCSVIIRRGGFVNLGFVRFFSSTELELSNISRASGSVALITSTEKRI